MNLLFLESAPNMPGLFGAMAGFLMVMVLASVLIMALLYVYLSFAFMSIAKKADYSMPSLAWIPIVGPLIISSQVAKMHWWPILLLLLPLIPVIGPVLGIFVGLAIAVFQVIWLWKTFEVIGKPEWWSILIIIPIVNLVIIGIAAWTN